MSTGETRGYLSYRGPGTSLSITFIWEILFNLLWPQCKELYSMGVSNQRKFQLFVENAELNTSFFPLV
jgi:hypothetical protein